MRSHIELIQDGDLIAHDARLPGGVGDVSERRLSTDEETGGATVLLEFDSPWGRPAGYLDGDAEWFVLEGSVHIGDRELGPGGYWRAPGGLRTPELEVAARSRVLQFRDGGYRFTPSAVDRSAIVPTSVRRSSGWPGELTIVEPDSAWVPDPGAVGCERHAALRARVLYQEPGPDWEPPAGATTLLLEYPAGWQDPAYEHDPGATEGFVLSGDADYNFGLLGPGRYFHRPARVKHGAYAVGPDAPMIVILRRAEAPAHWTTLDPGFRVEATALTYDPDNPAEAPGIVGLPLRSASTGRFSTEIR